MKTIAMFLLVLFVFSDTTPYSNGPSCLLEIRRPLVLKAVISYKAPDLSRLTAWEYICCHPDLKLRHIVFKQAVMESGMISDIAVNNHNIFGMRLPRIRATTAIGERKGYAVYSSWQSSVDDYAMFQKGFTGSSESDYYLFLRNYGDSAYVSNLKKAIVPIPKTLAPCKN